MFFLNSVIGEMPIDVAWIVVELLAAGAQIALPVPVGLKLTAVRSHKSIAADVELSILVEKRINVLLDQCAFANVCQFLDSFNYIFSTYLDRYTVSAIGVFSRFDDPCLGLAAQVLGQIVETPLYVVCQRDDVVFVELLFLAVFFYIFE